MSGVRPTGRGLVVLAGGLVAYLAGWTFGTRELAVLAVVLVLAPFGALLVVALARSSPVSLTRELPSRSIAGTPLAATVRIEPAPALVRTRLLERSAGLGDPAALLAAAPGGLAGSWRVADPRRGRYALAPELVLEDAFGLARTRVAIAPTAIVRVEPLLVELGAPRSQSASEHAGRRRAAAASAGDELAGVRDHEFGESLRRVHWGTSARRGKLTVRELEEPPRAQLQIVLDASASAANGDAFELAVRAAGSLAVYAVRSGRSLSFHTTGRLPRHVDVASANGLPALIDLLCSVVADGPRSFAELPAGSTAPLCIVTSELSPALAERVAALRARRRAVSVVAIDAASFAPGAPLLDSGAAARAGAEVVVVRAGDELAARLAPLTRNGVAGAA